ncbi:MAG: hypothetical protein H6502_03915 [Candidatus Woesearchaeota archaeon]|nr:MAG: hypothetical protein H6502_03915 [Candidatus Woesearchaeota archaeon]
MKLTSYLFSFERFAIHLLILILLGGVQLLQQLLSLDKILFWYDYVLMFLFLPSLYLPGFFGIFLTYVYFHVLACVATVAYLFARENMKK